MTRMLYTPGPTGQWGTFDIDLQSLPDATDLNSAVLISLFSDRRAMADDTLPTPGHSRQGWWADSYAQVSGDKIGSRLWLLQREKKTNETLLRAKEYCQEALAWLVEDGIALQVDVVTEWLIQHPSALGIQVTITRPESTQAFQYEYLWQELAGTRPSIPPLQPRYFAETA